MKAIIYFNGDSSVGIWSRYYEMPDLPDDVYHDEELREDTRKEIENLYCNYIDGEQEKAHVIFEPFEKFD
jgi:hypothetical protein